MIYLKHLVFMFLAILMVACGTIKVPSTQVETTGPGTDTGTQTATGTTTAQATPTPAPAVTAPEPTQTTTQTTVVQTITTTNSNLTVYSVNALQNLTTEAVVSVMTSIQTGDQLSNLQPTAQVLLGNPAACTLGTEYTGETYVDPVSEVTVVQVLRQRVCSYWEKVGNSYSYNYQVTMVDTMSGETVTSTQIVSVGQ